MAKLTWRIWLLIIFVMLSLIAIVNIKSFSSGIEIKSVVPNSTAMQIGLSVGEVIKQVNGQKIEKVEDYSNIVSAINLTPVPFTIVTNKGNFNYDSKTVDFEINENLTITSISGNAKKAGVNENSKLLKINKQDINSISDFEKAKESYEPKILFNIITNKNQYVLLFSQAPEITVENIPLTKIKTGLDLQGGARGLVKPERPLNSQEMTSLLETVRYRLNVYGLSDIIVKDVGDLEGNRYMLVEMAGASPLELQDLIAKQGKFEAKIGNDIVFVGGNKDVASVCRGDATCARIEQCTDARDGGQICRFSFAVYLSDAAAKRQAEMTSNLEINSNISSSNEPYLNETLDLYLDDKLVDTLFISADLKGKATTQISISGSGAGKDRNEAILAAQANMQKLQTILITGSLPFKLEIVKLDTISPALGKEFTRNVLVAVIAAFFTVCAIIYARYRKMKLFIPVVITIVCEALFTLALATVIRWNLDLASIAGIIAAIGTGVDDQVVMIEESESSTSQQYSMKERIKRAFFIIMSAYATVVVSLLPLLWAGAGLLKGFAITTFLGISVGVFITRPAFGDILSRITKD